MEREEFKTEAAGYVAKEEKKMVFPKKLIKLEIFLSSGRVFTGHNFSQLISPSRTARQLSSVSQVRLTT